MTPVRVLLADPDAVRVDGPDGVWAFSGNQPAGFRALAETADDPGEIRRGLVERTEDAVAVRVSPTDRGGSVDAFRSATSSRTLYTLTASDGALVVADHYRNALAELDLADRALDRTALVDHLLFRQPVEPRTYVEAVSRLGRGEWLHWDADADAWTRRVVDTLASAATVDADEGASRLDDALAAFTADAVDPDVRTMLSGGVDSTLLHTYRDAGAPAFHVAVDSPEHARETEYAETAADHLDTDLDVVTLEEAAFLDHLEAAVDALGRPPAYNQTAFTDAGLRAAGPGRYLNGHAADALFGLQGVTAARLAARARPLLSPRAAHWLDRTAPAGLAAQYAELVARADQLARPAVDPRSFAHDLAFYTDPDAVERVFDRRTVDDRARERTRTALARVDVAPDDGVVHHLAAAHALDYATDDAVLQWRQLGYAHDATLLAPFRTRSLARVARSIDPATRYVPDAVRPGALTPKHVPKAVLADRLPDYPVDRRKAAGSLPIARYLADGPLADAFERYPPPAVLPQHEHPRHVDAHGPLTWSLLAFAVWRDRVFHDPDLDHVPGTDRHYLRLPHAPAAPVA